MKKIMLKDGRGFISDIGYIKGSSEKCFFGVLRGDFGSVNLTYKCVAKKLILHEWYRLPENIIDTLYLEIENIFMKMGCVPNDD